MATAKPQTEWEKKQAALAAIGVKSEVLVANEKKKAEEGEVQYTLFASGLRHGRLDEFESKNQTKDLAIFFDAVTRHTYTKDYTKTSYGVESKSKASDHVVTQDGKFSFSAVITDSPQIVDERNYLDRDTDKDNPLESRRPAKAIQILEDIANAHQLVTLVTEDNILTNYVITNFTVDRSAETGSSIEVTVSMEEFRFKNISKTVLARTADPKKAKKANSGTKQTADGGAADDNAKAKRKTPYIGKNAAGKERIENALAGTTDFSGKAGAKLPFDPNNLLKR